MDIYPGDTIPVALNIHNANNLYAAQASCVVNPSVLGLQNGVFGNFFDPTLRLIATNQADAVAGRWIGAISQRNPAGPLSGNGLFATLNYSAIAPGTTGLTCESLFSDRNGMALPVSFTGTNVTVIPFGIVNGIVHYQGRSNHSGIRVDPIGNVPLGGTTNNTGNFSLDRLRTGTYDIKAHAALYLPACVSAVAVTSGQTMTLNTVTLLGGDLTANATINIGDLTRLGTGFGTPDPGADINADGTVNVQDLAILGGNYGISGCQAW